jgi:hypothetical protein
MVLKTIKIYFDLTNNKQQKELLIKQLQKYFGIAWEQLDAKDKMKFWKTGDTYRKNK